MKIEKPTKFIESGLQHRLDPRIPVEQITAALPGIEDEGESGDGKVTHCWHFIADGHECGVWDYRGLRWSAYGPASVFDRLGLTIIGGPQDWEAARRLSQEVRS